jgi:membrane protein
MTLKHKMKKRKDALKAGKESFASGYRSRRERFFRYLEDLGQRHPSISVLTKALEDFLRHNMNLHAGNFAYSAFLAIFPAVFLALAVVGYLFRYNPSAMQSTIDFIRKLIPDFGGKTIVNTADSLSKLRNVAGVIGILGLLWSVSRISYAIDTGFTAVWQTRKQSYFKKKVFAFGVLLLVGLAGVMGLAITFLSSQFLSWIDKQTGPVISALTFVLGLFLSPAATLLIFAVLYRVMPRKKPGFREVFWGALIAALSLDAVEYLLSFYFTSISKQQALYGSIGVILGVVLWLYVVGIMVFFGAEIVHVLQEKRGLGLEAPDESVAAREDAPAIPVDLP